MTIAEALKELKRIDAIMLQRRATITRYCSKMKGSRDEVENQEKYVKEQTQSAQDLLKRYSAIKTVIQTANLTAFFEVKGKKYTLAEAILYKQYLMAQYEALWASFNTGNAQTQLSMDNTYRRTIAGLTQEQAVKLDMVPEVYYDEKLIQKNKEDLLELKLNMDAMIDKTNHATTIEF